MTLSVYFRGYQRSQSTGRGIKLSLCLRSCHIGLETLIPFGRNLQTGMLVDVASVPRGIECKCICPSCSATLIAKQGKQNEWHFAHSIRRSEDCDIAPCEYSFAVSVRLMLLQIFNKRLTVLTPDFAITRESQCPLTGNENQFSFEVTKPMLVSLDSLETEVLFSGVRVDFLGYINDYPFVVYLAHKGRAVPESILQPEPKKSGCIAIYLDDLQLYLRREKRGRYTSALREFLEHHSTAREWIYHPRVKVGIQNLNKQEEEWLLVQKDAHNKKQGPSMYQCVNCRSEWIGNSRECASCGTHLFTKESRKS